MGNIVHAKDIVGMAPVVSSISGLLAVNTAEVSTITVTDYHVGLEGGGGVFVWDSSRDKADHNGGTVIDPTRVFPTTWTDQGELTTWFTAGTGTGCWVRKTDGVIDARMFGAKGDGATSDNLALPGADFVSSGTYLVDDTYDTSSHYGPGVVKKSYGNISLPPGNNPAVRDTISSAVLSQINPRGIFVDGNYAYICNQGSYNAAQQGTLDIIDIRDPYNATLVSTLNIGAVGVTPRALSVKGNHLYIQSVGGLLYVINIIDRSTPVLAATVTLNTGNREYSAVYGDTLIIPKQTNDIDFYTLRDPIAPKLITTLTATGSFFEPILDGCLMWVPSHNAGLSANLLCVDISDVLNPTTVSFTTFATLKYARRGVIKGKYLYMGGFDATSRLHIIDISDPVNPVVAYTHATETAAYVEIVGNLLFTRDKVYDITDPIDPILISTFADSVERPIAVGAYLMSLGPGTGAQGPQGNDGNADPTLRISRISNYTINSITTGSIQTQRSYTDELIVRNHVRSGAMEAGGGGISTTGRMSGNRLSSGGVIDNSLSQAEAVKGVSGSIVSNTNIFSINGQDSHIVCELHYTLITDQSAAGSAAHTSGVKNFSFYVSGEGAATIRIPVGNMVAERVIGTTAVLAITLTNGTATTPVLLGVSCPQLSVANSRAMFRIKVQSDQSDLNVLQL